LANLSNKELATHGISRSDLVIAQEVVQGLLPQGSSDHHQGPKLVFKRQNSLLMKKDEAVQMVAEIHSAGSGR